MTVILWNTHTKHNNSLNIQNTFWCKHASSQYCTYTKQLYLLIYYCYYLPYLPKCATQNLNSTSHTHNTDLSRTINGFTSISQKALAAEEMPFKALDQVLKGLLRKAAATFNRLTLFLVLRFQQSPRHLMVHFLVEREQTNSKWTKVCIPLPVSVWLPDGRHTKPNKWTQLKFYCFSSIDEMDKTQLLAKKWCWTLSLSSNSFPSKNKQIHEPFPRNIHETEIEA